MVQLALSYACCGGYDTRLEFFSRVGRISPTLYLPYTTTLHHSVSRRRGGRVYPGENASSRMKDGLQDACGCMMVGYYLDLLLTFENSDTLFPKSHGESVGENCSR